MHDTDRLKQSLERAASGAEKTAIDSPQACLAQILDEIDMVVLPRDVTFDNGAGQTLSLTVKSRRLVRINGHTPNIPGAMPNIVDTELSTDAEQMTTLAHLMAGFSAEATHLSTSLSDPAQLGVLTEMGVSVGQLHEALTGAGYALPTRQIDIIAELSRLAAAQGLTWARFASGELDASDGDIAPLCAAQEAALPHILKTERPPKAQAASWMLGAQAPNGPTAHTSITVEGDRVLIAMVPQALTQTWIKACAGRAAG